MREIRRGVAVIINNTDTITGNNDAVYPMMSVFKLHQALAICNLFERLVNVSETDSFIATLIPRSSFQIAYTESEMAAEHTKAYSNYTSPLGAALLMNMLFTDTLVSSEKQSFIKKALNL